MAQRTIADFERDARTPFGRTLSDISEALKAGGVVFLAEDDREGGGVRLKKPSSVKRG